MYSLKKMTQKISKTYTLSFPKAAHSLEAQDQGDLHGSLGAGMGAGAGETSMTNINDENTIKC